jgi:dihydrofolate reductase
MILSCIVAVADNGVMGRGNSLPWRLSADLKRFKELTTGHTLIMGRKTFESIGRPLPNRTSIVLTRDPGYQQPGAVVVHSLEEALQRCQGEQEVFAIGGAAVFREALPRAQRLYLTRVHADVAGDVRFPEEGLAGWQRIAQTALPADEKNEYATTYEVYARSSAPVQPRGGTPGGRSPRNGDPS